MHVHELVCSAVATVDVLRKQGFDAATIVEVSACITTPTLLARGSSISSLWAAVIAKTVAVVPRTAGEVFNEWCAAVHERILLWIDFVCLPQKVSSSSAEDERTTVQKKLIRDTLRV